MVDVLILLRSALIACFARECGVRRKSWFSGSRSMCCGAFLRRDLFFRPFGRLVFVGLYRLAPTIVDVLAIVRPGTVVRWHRAGFRSFWRWKSRRRGGRPSV